jgi:hypothetical protein
VWDLRFAKTEAIKGWADICREFNNQACEAWLHLTERPTEPSNRDRQHPLKGKLSTHVHQGKLLQMWQYEVTYSGRIWYCPDPDDRTVWMIHAGTKHPKKTERRRR